MQSITDDLQGQLACKSRRINGQEAIIQNLQNESRSTAVSLKHMERRASDLEAQKADLLEARAELQKEQHHQLVSIIYPCIFEVWCTDGVSFLGKKNFANCA